MSRHKVFLSKFFFFFLIILFVVSPKIFAQNTPEITTLETDKPFAREISGKETHFYQITIAAGQVAEIELVQRGIDVQINLISADKKSLAIFDGEQWTNGTEKIVIYADTSQTFKLEVKPVFSVLSAGSYEIKLSTIRIGVDNDKLLQDARIAYAESERLRRQGKMKEAFAEISKAFEIREKILGKDDTEIAVTLDTLAFYYYSRGDLKTTKNLLERSLTIKEKNLPPEHPEIAQTLHSFGLVTTEAGEYQKAEMFLKKAIAISEKSLGKDHPSVTKSLNSLGSVYLEKEEFDAAELLYLRAAAIEEKIYGKNTLETANVINNLGLLNDQRGDLDKALGFYQTALAIYEKNLPPEHPSIALGLNNVGTIYQNKQQFDKAEPLFLRSLAIREKTLGADNPAVGQSLYNLGGFYLLTDNFVKAEEMFKKSLAILESKLGPEHISLKFPLSSLGGVYRNTGRYNQAEELFLRVIKLKEKVLGNYHTDMAFSLQSIASVYAAKNQPDKAFEALKKSSEITERALALNLATGSERQKFAYLALSAQSTNQILSIQNMFPDDTNLRELALTTILQRKGRIQDAMVDTFGRLKQKSSGEQKILFEKLNELNAKLANLVLNEPKGVSVDEYQKHIETLEAEKEKIEIEISRTNAEYANQIKPVTVQAINRSLDKDTALIEFTAYRKYNPKSKTRKDELGEWQYAAYLINGEGEIKSFNLGDANTIDGFVEKYRKAIAEPKNADFKKVSRELDTKLFSMIRPKVSNQKRLLISPEGGLNLIPFEALISESGKYLVEDFAVSYLTSGRDLLRMQTPRESIDKSLIVANPSYGSPDNLNADKTDRKGTTAIRNLTDNFFAPIIGTAEEAAKIREIFPDAAVLTKNQATETAIKKVNAPKILHIATHGFFLEDKDFLNNSVAKIENPMVRSGLAFAGANERKTDGTDDGILTALEASGLNLWGTKLVVLSACDTGLGEIKNGEGVYGLRRAFTLAGTETLVMSLWAVSDQVTRELMTDFYKNLKEGTGRGESLRQTQLEMIKNPKRNHPFYWASFIQSGEWANLQGKR